MVIGRAMQIHLPLGLQALCAGDIKRGDAPATRMSPLPEMGARHKELHETLAEGICVEVLSAGAWKEPGGGARLFGGELSEDAPPKRAPSGCMRALSWII